MPTVKVGIIATVSLPALSTISLSGNGTVTEMISGKPQTPVSFDYSFKHGPFNSVKLLAVAAIGSDVEYSVSDSEYQPCQFWQGLLANLPTVGKSGVIYMTEQGLRWWSEVSGEYLDEAGAPSLPVLSDGGDPVVSCSGDGEVGDVLTVSNGTWDYRPTSFSYQWSRGESEISGATGKTHTIVLADQGEDITCAVTATNAAGDCETPAASAAYSVPAGE